MDCTYEEGKTSDLVSFQRPGASGELHVTKDKFVLDARLGILLGIFKDRIESEIVNNLDQLLAEKEPLKAFEKGLADHEAKRQPKKAPKVAPAPKAAAKAAARKAK